MVRRVGGQYLPGTAVGVEEVVVEFGAELLDRQLSSAASYHRFGRGQGHVAQSQRVGQLMCQGEVWVAFLEVVASNDQNLWMALGGVT